MNLPMPSLRPDDGDELAALCKAAGDPLRLNVLRARLVALVLGASG